MAILEQRKKNNTGSSGNNTTTNTSTSTSTSTNTNTTSLLSNSKNHNNISMNKKEDVEINSINTEDDIIQIRIKPNVQNSRNNYHDVTLSIARSSTVYQLKEQIRSSCYNKSVNNSDDSDDNDDSNDNDTSHTRSSSSNNDGNGSSNGDTTDHSNTNTTTTASTISRDRYLRLICSGRLLAPDSTVLSDFKCIKDGSFIHAILAAPGVRGGQQATLSRDRRHSSQRRPRGIGIGSNGLILPRRNNSNDDDDDNDDIEEGRQRRGFDRLRANGMSRSEIAAIRTYFSRQVDHFIEQRNQLENSNDTTTNATTSTNSNSSTDDNTNTNDTANANGNTNANEDPRIQRLRREEEWMERQGPYSEFRLNINSSNPLLRSRAYINGIEIDTTTGGAGAMNDFRSGGGGSSIMGALGTNRDFIWGFVLGYSFGFMTMFIVWLPTVPHKQRVGILCGFCFHMTLRIMERKAIQES